MAGIYIHIPFCKTRCRYCDFYSTTQLHQQDAYTQALIQEWHLRCPQWLASHPHIHTIYLGGGTPSLLSTANLQALLTAIYADIDTSHLREVTLEANPGDFTLEKVQSWQALGIDRLSIGIQSFNDKTLEFIGRRHNSAMAKQAVEIAQQAGITNISIDLMYALPHQTMADWQSDVAQALQLGVPHISSYGLIYEDGTRLTQLLENGQIQAVDEELEMQMYDYLIAQLTAHGYEHYEVSNFALPGMYSQHNSSYWNDTPYLGLGAGAHSYDGTKRWWNVCDIDLFIEQAASQTLSPEQEELTPQQRHFEHVMLGLRTNKGVPLISVNSHQVQRLLEDGLVTIDSNRVIATTKGFHLLNRVIEELV
ncbi:MAG: radical SAM family heme chaperone HemW [Paludibacteraceae bacterium]|nr:radical SAM family heme chaperone HemW [Paludibacteraceae bacterium]